MRSRSFLLLLSSLSFAAVGAACGGQAIVGLGADGSSSGSAGAFTVMSDRPVAGTDTAASYHLEAAFNPVPASCGTATVGACTVNPCYAATSGTAPSPLPDVGSVEFLGAQIAELPLEPQSNGTYTTLNFEGEVPWATSGDAVSVTWAHAPGAATQAGGSMHLAAPPYLALSATSAFGGTTSMVSRQEDLTLSWTSDSAPSTVDQLLVDVTLAPTQLVCVFNAAAGTGTVPAAALGYLSAGVGSYDVHSKEYASVPLQGVDGATWAVGFNVDAHARAGNGLAYGAATIE
jgi:hypothetical protein